MGTRLGTELGTILGTALGTDLAGASAPPPLYPPAVSLITGLTNFNITDRVGTAVGQGPQGFAAGFTWAFTLRVKSQVASARLFDVGDGTGKGGFLTQDSATSVVVTASNLASGFVNTSRYYPAGAAGRATDIGKDVIYIFTSSGPGGYIELWAGQPGESVALVARGVSNNGYQVSAAVRAVVGLRQNGSAAHTGMTAYGWLEVNRVITNAEKYALADEYYETGYLPETGNARLPSGATHCYNFGKDIIAAGGAVATTYLDRVGSHNMTLYNGTVAGLAVETNAASFVHTNVVPNPRDLIIGFGDSMTDGRGDPADFPTVYPGFPPLNGSIWMLRPRSNAPYYWEQANEPSGTGAAGASSCVGYLAMLCGKIRALNPLREVACANGGVGGSLSASWLPGQINGDAFRNMYEVSGSRRNTTFRLVTIYGHPNDAAQVSQTPYLTNVQAVLTQITARLGAIPRIYHMRPTTQVPTDTTYAWWGSIDTDILSQASSTYRTRSTPTPANREAYFLHHKTDQNALISDDIVSDLVSNAILPWS